MAELRTEELLRKQAQAMLDLYEADHGRAAITLEEIKQWAYRQNDDNLRCRLERFLSKSDLGEATSTNLT
jgi:hypothetical protein